MTKSLTAVKLSPDLLEGEAMGNTWSGTKGGRKQEYEIWKHAESLLSFPTFQEENRVAALVQLNRAIDFRDRRLNEIYGFKQLPNMQRKKTHEVMVELGLILPLMKKKLDGLRNSLTHDLGVKAPDLQPCRDLCEFTWYYLRSTDRLISSEAELHVKGDLGLILHLDFSPRPFAVSVRGAIPRRALYTDADSDYVEVCSSTIPIADRNDRLPISGNVVGSEESLRKLVKIFFDIITE